MTILEIISSRRWIGEAAHAFQLTRMLIGRGHKVILVSKKGWEVSARAREQGIEPIELAMNGRFNISDNFSDISKLVGILRKEQVDVIHCHRGHDHWLSVAAVKISGKKIPIVRTRHVNVPVRTHFFNRWLYYNTNKVICVSAHIKEGYLKTGIVTEDKLSLVYTGADLSEFDFKRDGVGIREEFGIAADSPVIGIVGRIAPIKGHKYLINALPEIKKKYPDAKLIFPGDVRDEETDAKLKNIIKDLGLQKDVIFPGYRRDVADIAACFDVSVIASKGSEGSSRACYEYMAMKKPIVATRVGIIPELIEDGVSGIIIPPKSSDAMAKAVIELLGDRKFAGEMGERAYSMLVEKFNARNWLENTEKVLGEDAKG